VLYCKGKRGIMKFEKIKEFTKEELYQQLDEGKIDIEFLFDYIVKIDEVYNKLIDRVNELEEQKKGLRGTIESQNETAAALIKRIEKALELIKNKKIEVEVNGEANLSVDEIEMILVGGENANITD